MQLFVCCPLVTQVGEYCNGVIALEVNPSDTVEEVKSMIHERGGLSPEKQQLSFVGETLEDDRKLSSYKIGSNCLLEETSMWVSVRIQSSKIILLSVDGKETVGSVKSRIEKKEIFGSQETILYGNHKKLENQKTLEESEIVNQSRLYLRISAHSPSVESVELFAKLGKTHKFSLYVELNDTVEDLKYLIYEKENIFPDEQEIIYMGHITLASDCRTLKSYNIEHKSTVFITIKKVLTSITITNTVTRKKFELAVSPRDSVFSVKAKIQDLEGISPDHQQLNIAGKLFMRDDRMTLAQYNVQQGDKIELRTYHRESIMFVTIISTMISEGFTLSVNHEMSVFSLKQLISRTVGILFGSQILLWEGRVLENNTKLRDCGIFDGSVLQLVEQPVKNYKIYVSDSNVNDLEVSSTSPVLMLNEIYPGKDLIFDGKKLDPDCCLGDYKIQCGHIVHTANRNRCTRTHISRASDLRALTFFVDLDETILSLKMRIWADDPTMPPPSQQRLLSNDLPLEDSQILEKRLHSFEVSIPQYLFVRCPNGTAITIGVHTTDKVAVLKHLICKKIKVIPGKQQLYYNGKVMDDECVVKSYNVGTDSMLQLCKFTFIMHIILVMCKPTCLQCR